MARKTPDVKLLGAKAEIPASPDKAILDRVANPHPDTHYAARFAAALDKAVHAFGRLDFALLFAGPGLLGIFSRSLLFLSGEVGIQLL